MNHFHNSVAKDTTLSTSTSEDGPSTSSTSSLEHMPAPPAYHMVVDPNMPIPNLRNPYDHIEEDDDKDEEDAPEVTINATTQIRGHGNIVSIAQMDSMRVANLISAILTGDPNKAAPDGTGRPLTPPSPTARVVATSRTEMRGVKMYPSINITVNCGATIIGDRNIVGPGLGDIARQMQMAQRNQAVQQQQQQAAQAAAQAAAAAAGQSQKTASGPTIATPPMSRSSSLHSDACVRKRKTEELGEGCAAKRAR
ncbi:hypothetical protein PTT_18062 [Pyrenophora teres f. teres 0-1]|uniref:Uncharacterized protein n=2 Tax=Pyrenophora teres f. teres TaxID=97479 RepID=E3S5V4_PYRTT|nr:hypothetical protein PTT_18062 [Pyrenophora teres f. teres 0-1]CAE7009957.1 hypothetical protein PTTW11_01930 [Pyrenophora teres f. teres]